MKKLCDYRKYEAMKTLLTSFVALLLSSMAFAADPDRLNEVVSLREAADSLHSIGRTDSAAVVGESAIRLAEEIGDPVQIVGTHAAQGVFLRSSGDLEGALDNYNKALEIVTSGQFRQNPTQEAIEEIASLYINLAVLNLDMQHKDEAARNAVFSGEWAARSTDPDLQSMIFGVVGSVLTGCGELEKALPFQADAYHKAVETGNDEAAFRAAAYAMLTADRLGDKSQAQQWRNRCVDLLPKIDSTTAKLMYYQCECSICLKNGDQKKAIAYFDKILSLDGIDNMPFIQYDCYNNMHIAYAGLGDFEAAYKTLLKSNELRDSIWEQEKTESLRDLMVKYETKETELALAQSESRRANNLMWIFLAVSLLIIVITAFIIYANLQRRRRMRREMEFSALRADAERKLTDQYIEGLETERQRMSRELHDGVCNDLLVIQMNLRESGSSEATARLIESCRESVRRISHELMPPEFAYATIDEVVRYYLANQQQSGKTVMYTSDTAGRRWDTVPDNIAFEVYRIIQEAVGNSLRHSGGDTIGVSMNLDGDVLNVTITDNGHYASNGKRGLGIISMKRRAKAINADIDISMSETDGTRITIVVRM